MHPTEATSDRTPGLHLQLDEDRRALLEPVRRFAGERLQPLLNDTGSDAQRLTALQGVARLGLGSAALPARRDGLEADALQLCLLLEELATGPLALATEATLSLPVVALAREVQALEAVLPADVDTLFSGQCPVGLGITSAQDGHLFTLGTPRLAGLVALLGDPQGRPTLLWLDEAGLAGAGLHAQTEQAMAGPQPVGLHCEALRAHASHAVELSWRQFQQAIVWQSLWAAGLLAGAARAATQFAFGYAQTRLAFQRPIIQHQAVSLRLADMAIATDSMRLMVWDLASRFDEDEDEAVSLLRLTSTARQVATSSLEVHRHAVQVCGGHGYVEGFPPARRFQDARVLTLLLLALAKTAQGAAPTDLQHG